MFQNFVACLIRKLRIGAFYIPLLVLYGLAIIGGTLPSTFLLPAYFIVFICLSKHPLILKMRAMDMLLYTTGSVLTTYYLLSFNLNFFAVQLSSTGELVGLFIYGMVVSGLLIKFQAISPKRDLNVLNALKSSATYPSLLWAIYLSHIALCAIFISHFTVSFYQIAIFFSTPILGFIAYFTLQSLQQQASEADKPAKEKRKAVPQITLDTSHGKFIEWLTNEVPLEKDTSTVAQELGLDTQAHLTRLKDLISNQNNIAVIGKYGSGKTSLSNLALDAKDYAFEVIKVDITTWGHSPNAITEFILGKMLDKLTEHFDVFRFRGLPEHYAASLQAAKPGLLRILGKYLSGVDEKTSFQLGTLNNILKAKGLVVYLVIDDIERNPDLESLLPQVAALLDEVKAKYSNIRFILNLAKNLDDLPRHYPTESRQPPDNNDSNKPSDTVELIPPPIAPNQVLLLDNIGALNRTYSAEVNISNPSPQPFWNAFVDAIERRVNKALVNTCESNEGKDILRIVIAQQLSVIKALLDSKKVAAIDNPRELKFIARQLWHMFNSSLAARDDVITIVPIHFIIRHALHNANLIDTEAREWRDFPEWREVLLHNDRGTLRSTVIDTLNKAYSANSSTLLATDEVINCLNYLYSANESQEAKNTHLFDSLAARLIKLSHPFMSEQSPFTLRWNNFLQRNFSLNVLYSLYRLNLQPNTDLSQSPTATAIAALLKKSFKPDSRDAHSALRLIEYLKIITGDSLLLWQRFIASELQITPSSRTYITNVSNLLKLLETDTSKIDTAAARLLDIYQRTFDKLSADGEYPVSYVATCTTLASHCLSQNSSDWYLLFSNVITYGFEQRASYLKEQVSDVKAFPEQPVEHQQFISSYVELFPKLRSNGFISSTPLLNTSFLRHFIECSDLLFTPNPEDKFSHMLEVFTSIYTALAQREAPADHLPYQLNNMVNEHSLNIDHFKVNEVRSEFIEFVSQSRDAMNIAQGIFVLEVLFITRVKTGHAYEGQQFNALQNALNLNSDHRLKDLRAVYQQLIALCPAESADEKDTLQRLVEKLDETLRDRGLMDV